jgi:L-malate glycosyltransferase
MLPMKIVIVTPQFPSQSSHLGVFVAEQARALSRHGHSVTVVVTQQRAREALRGIRLTELRWQDLRVVQVEYPIVRLTWYLPCAIGLLAAFRRLRRHLGLDIIHAHFTFPVGIAALAAGRILGIPVIITEHTGPVAEMCRIWISILGLRLALRHADAVVSVSEHLKNEMTSEAKLKRPITVIPNLFDCARFYPMRDDGRCDSQAKHEQPLDVLFIGRGGDARKGNDLIIKAWAKVLSRSLRLLRLVLVGPTLEEELKPLITDLGIVNHCVFTGALPPDRLASLMRECGFLVVASRYETFSLATVEAMACGKPVVATRCGGPDELLTPETGVLVPVDDVEALAKAIIGMSENIHHYDAGVIARHASERYGEAVVVQQLNKLYETLVNNHHP